MVGEPIQAGRVLAGRYRLERKLGEGGFGAVWRAQHITLEAPIALKLIDPEIAQDDVAKERFLREAKALASLRSPHVVQIIDYGGVEEKQPFIAMELLEGENLAQRLKRVGALSSTETLWIMTHVARAIGRAHESGIVHRDLKPENVFIVRNDDEEVAKVLDFGVAKIDEGKLGTSGSATRTGSLLGTPYYMSPEQALGNKQVDYRSDLWSMGVIAFEMLTGKRPFYSEGLGDLVVQITVRPLPVPSEFAPVPPRFDAWFAEVMSRDPEARPGSAREVVESLRSVLDAEAGSLVTVPGPAESESTLRGWPGPAPVPEASRPGGPDALAPTQRRPDVGPPGKVNEPIAMARTLNMDVATMGQFGTSAEPNTPRRSRRTGGRLLAVAAGALVLGAGAGFVWLRLKPGPESDEVEAPKLRSLAVSRVERVDPQVRLPDPAPTARPKRTRQAAAPGPSTSSSAATPAGSVQNGDQDGGPPEEWLPKEGPDGGIIKPEWAEPDEPDSPPDPEGDLGLEEPGSDDNPY